MALGDLHMTKAPAPDYAAPHCSGQGCPHSKPAYLIKAGQLMRKAAEIPCQHHHNTGAPAAFWARFNQDGTCPHFEAINMSAEEVSE